MHKGKSVGKEVKKLSEVDKAWIAGFFDGEGCWSIGKGKAMPRRADGTRPMVNPAYSTYAKVTNTDPRPMKWLASKLGGSVNRRPTRDNCKECYTWKVYPHDLIEFTNTILPYLKIKKEIAEVCRDLRIRIQKAKIVHRTTGYGSMPLPPDEIAEREKLWLRARQLNKRGR